MSFHNDHTPGELIERIDGDVTELATFFSQFVLNLLRQRTAAGRHSGRAVPRGLAGRAGFHRLSLRSPLSGAQPRARYCRAAPKDRRQAEAELFGFIEEQLAGTEDIRSSGAVDFSIRELFRLQGIILRHNRKAHQKGWMASERDGAGC